MRLSGWLDRPWGAAGAVASAAAVVLVIANGAIWSTARSDGILEIHCLDVEQADATLIIAPSGDTFLFDAGWKSGGTSAVIPHLNSLGIDTLTYIGASHYHADHVGGIIEVLEAGKKVRECCYDRAWSYTTQTYQQYAAAVASFRETIADGQVIDLGEGVTITCVCVNGNGVLSPPYEVPHYDENDFGIALVVSYGAFDFFVAGDLSGYNGGGYTDVETSVAPEVGDIDVYQVNHHGSNYSSNTFFMGTLLPEAAVFSVGDGGSFPYQGAIDRIHAVGAHMYLTSDGGGVIPPGGGEVVGGHVIITTDGVTSYTIHDDQYPLAQTSVEEYAAVGVPGTAPTRPQVWPNPAYPNGALAVQFVSPPGADARLLLYDIRGRLLGRLSEVSDCPVGPSIVRPTAAIAGRGPLPPGVYFLRLDADGKLSKATKLIIVQ